MALQDDFEKAAVDIKGLPSRPSNKDLLELYAFFKQGKVGDVSGDRPPKFDLFNRSKHDAWRRIKGMGQEEAMQNYVDKVNHMLTEAGMLD